MKHFSVIVTYLAIIFYTATHFIEYFISRPCELWKQLLALYITLVIVIKFFYSIGVAIDEALNTSSEETNKQIKP